LWFGFALTAAVALSDLVLSPIHASGRAQRPLGYILGASHLVNMPGFTFSGLLGLRPRDSWTLRAFAVAIVIDLLFWTAVAVAGLRLWRRLTGSPHPAPQPAPEPTPVEPHLTHDPRRGRASGAPATDPPPRIPPPSPRRRAGDAALSRRALLAHGTRTLAASGVGLGTYALLAQGRWFDVTRRQVPITGLSPALDGLRIVHLTDIHHSRWMSLQWLRQIVDAANALNPDVVALTGDYVYRGLEYVHPAARELARLRPRVGTVGVMGNHDWWQNGELTQWAYAKEGIPLIDNTRRYITPDRKLVPSAREGLCLAGVGDLWTDVCLYDDALAGVPGGMPRILLSHNPDVAEEPAFLASGHRVDLMLSGHTHGGQIRLPALGTPITSSRYGSKYASGLIAGPACPVFVSKGLGMTGMPIRWGVRPEIALLELRTA
jgi:predicted MPP superfamily phosphohydrolase